MVLHESPFPNACIDGLHSAAWAMIFPCFWSLDHMIAVCIPTTPEKRQKQEQECYLWPLKVFFSFLLCLVLLVVCVPLALVGFIVWAPLQAVRRPFSYSCVKAPMGDGMKQWAGYGEGMGFSFLEANLCFLPNCLARFNNLARTQRRAAQIATHICESVDRPRIKVCVDSPTSMTASSQSGGNSLTPDRESADFQNIHRVQEPGELLPVTNNLHYIDSSEESSEVENVLESLCTGQETKGHPSEFDAVEQSHPAEVVEELSEDQPGRHSVPPQALANNQCRPQKKKSRKEGLVVEISPLIPADVAFVCLLEVFEKRAAMKLKQLLQSAFGHILYDVGVYGFQDCCKYKFLNSGIFFASRYPILHAEYNCFPRTRGEDALAAKGLLCVKVQVGLTQKGHRIVGYISCTHLQATAEDSHIRQSQLSYMVGWISAFMSATGCEDEKVVFDVLCGDFNFDSCSLEDHLEQQHQILKMYKDPCCSGPGKEKPGVIGTLLEQRTMYEEPVINPENLQRALEIDELRKQYLAFPITCATDPTENPETSTTGGGRRIDYLLYREDTIAKEVTTHPIENNIASLWGNLDDHCEADRGMKWRSLLLLPSWLG
ncbi:sphingomyelin phosphodiesterase 5-like isoform X2 [Narcine bancroftii]|uniref:sphingomyelin phosphodiesterase 5-like isoform X2 n=1 Tax=Narcine bancroftii TaxID=1343680 RepID=UPI0038320DD6